MAAATITISLRRHRDGIAQPYQFSNEVVEEFRVSSSGYGAESGRAGGAVVNVVTKSGTNQWHGSTFYFLRDSSLGGAKPAFVGFNPSDRQRQFGGTIGGPTARNKMFYLRDMISTFFMCLRWCSSATVRR
jgi:hypothetical protein